MAKKSADKKSVKLPAGYYLKFYAVIIQKDWLKKRFHAILKGLNNETVFTSQRVHNKKDLVDVLKTWYPGIEIKIKKMPWPMPR